MGILYSQGVQLVALIRGLMMVAVCKTEAVFRYRCSTVDGAGGFNAAGRLILLLISKCIVGELHGIERDRASVHYEGYNALTVTNRDA